MKKTTLFVVILLISLSIKAQTIWKLDPSHSRINFSIKHLVISELDGNFTSFKGTIKSFKNDLKNAEVHIKIESKSINTNNNKRDSHLNSEDFFHTSKYPIINFDSTSFRKKGKNKYRIKGALTLRGITKTEIFTLKYGGKTTDAYGNTRIGFIAKSNINRLDYEIAWNSKTKQGTWTLGKNVTIIAKLEYIKQ